MDKKMKTILIFIGLIILFLIGARMEYNDHKQIELIAEISESVKQEEKVEENTLNQVIDFDLFYQITVFSCYNVPPDEAWTDLNLEMYYDIVKLKWQEFELPDSMIYSDKR